MIIAVALTTFIFASLAICTAMLARSHADQGMLSNFVITPMAFLCGTFFPLESYPEWIGTLVSVLPLTPAAKMIRAAAQGNAMPGAALTYLCISAVLSFAVAVVVIRQSKR